MGLFDVHAHLTHPQLLDDLDAVLSRARAAGVTTIVSNGLNPRDNAAVLALSQARPMVKPALGFYPVDAVLSEMQSLGLDYPRDAEIVTASTAIDWLRDHLDAAFAVGEIGLDGHWVPESLWARQEQVFRELVALAMQADKPIIVHTRKRERRVFEILVEMGAQRVNWHCFGGKLNLARAIAAHGHWLSIPANARRAQGFERMLQVLPRHRLLLETDCPYLAPQPGERCEPAHVADTAAFASELWGCSSAEVERQLAQNFCDLFGVQP